MSYLNMEFMTSLMQIEFNWDYLNFSPSTPYEGI